MRNEIEKEIDQDIQLRMVRRAQQVGLYVIDKNTGKKKLVKRTLITIPKNAQLKYTHVLMKISAFDLATKEP